MRLKITLSLLAILLGLLAYIFYIEPTGEDDSDAFRAKNILGEIAVGIDYLSIHNSTTNKTITFELKGKKWGLIKPYEWPGNEFAIQKILTQLRFLKRITSFETSIANRAGVSLGDYGLAPPELSVVFGRGDQRYTLGIGKVTEIGNNLYILSVDQKHVHVVERNLLDSLSVSLDDLRSPRLFNAAVFEVSSWNIQVKDDTRNLRARFARNGDNWTFETPIRARANANAVNTLLNRCLNLEAQSIIASNPSDLSTYGLESAPYRIAIESGNQREVLEIGNPISTESQYRYAKKESQSTIFQIRIDFLDILENAQTKLRQRRIFEIDVTEAATVTIAKHDAPPLTLQKLENGSWELVIRDPSQGIQTLKGDAKAIEDMLLWLDQLKAVPDTGFVNDAPSAPDLESYGLEVPEFTITLTSNKRHNQAKRLDTSESTTLQIGERSPRNSEECFVKIDNKDFVYSVYNDLFDRIDTSPNSYKDRQIIDVPEGSKIIRITVTKLSDNSEIAVYAFDDETEPNPNAQTLERAIANLRAESFNPNGFTSTVDIAGRTQPWAYTVVAEIKQANESKSDTKTITLYVSETTGGPLLLGSIPKRNLGFRFNLEFIDAFSKIVFDRVPHELPANPFSETPLPRAPSKQPNKTLLEPVQESPEDI